MTNIVIPPEDWAATPPSIQNLVQNLVVHINAAQEAMNQAERQKQEYEQLLKQCGAVAAKRARAKKQVVFVCDAPTPRQAKLAYGLKRNGWEVILLHRDPAWFDPSLYFDESARYSSANQAALLASAYSPTVYHSFSSWNFKTSIALIDSRPGKVIFDSYDSLFSLQGEVASQSSDAIKEERYCYENANGSCHRHSSAWYARRKLGYRVARPIFFPEYSWGGMETLGIPRKPKRRDGIHCVYVGNVDPQAFVNPALFTNVDDIQFTRSLTDKGIHYHLYPSIKIDDAQFLTYFAPMLEEQARNKFFHLHRPLPYEKLIEEISQYHFGPMCLAPDVINKGNYYSAVNFRSVTANKAFDYLDAGLVLISHGFRACESLFGKACEVVPRLEVGDFLSRITPAQFELEYPSHLQSMLARLSVARQAARLGSYYESF